MMTSKLISILHTLYIYRWYISLLFDTEAEDVLQKYDNGDYFLVTNVPSTKDY